MNKSSVIRTGRHCVFNLHVHLVFLTKYRRDVFQEFHFETIQKIFSKVCNDFEAELIEVDGKSGHVHLLVSYPPKVSVSSLVNSLKGVSSRLLRKEHPELQDHYWKDVLWTPSYFAGSCGGAPITILRRYIEQQRGE